MVLAEHDMCRLELLQSRLRDAHRLGDLALKHLENLAKSFLLVIVRYERRN